MLPVWLLLAPRDYLSTFMKVGTIIMLAFVGSLFPFLFITIACGALSGFHALIASGTTPKMIEKVPSKIFALSSFIPTPAEKKVLAQWKAAGLEPNPEAGKEHT